MYLVGGMVYKKTCCSIGQFGRFALSDGNLAGCVALLLIGRDAINGLKVASF